MSKGNPFLALRLSPDTIERLRELAARQGRGISDLAREALAAGLVSDPSAAHAAAAVGRDTHRAARSPRPRKASRVQRVCVTLEELRKLLDEYTDWQENLPEFAEATATAEKLEAAVEALQVAVEALEDLDLPRGYGRD